MASEIEEALLGNAPETILDAVEGYQPRISAQQFETEVVDILTNPFGSEALMAYLPYVGELTQPLHVVKNDDPSIILHTVPALVQTTRSSIPMQDGMNADTFYRSLTRDQDLGGRNVHRKVATWLRQITETGDYRQQVLLPLRRVLQAYGRDFSVAIPGVTDSHAVPDDNGGTSSFGDEYDD